MRISNFLSSPFFKVTFFNSFHSIINSCMHFSVNILFNPIENWPANFIYRRFWPKIPHLNIVRIPHLIKLTFLFLLQHNLIFRDKDRKINKTSASKRVSFLPYLKATPSFLSSRVQRDG